MKIILVFISVIVFAMPSFAYNQIDYKPIDAGEKISYPKIDKIEQIVFGKTNENLDITHRLNIIEKKIFNKVYDNKDFSQRIDNIIAKLPQENFFDVDLNELSQIEDRILGKVYKNETFQKRLERLEKKVFGAVQYGEIEQRYSTLKTASVYYSNSSEPVFSEPTYKTPNYSYSQPKYTQTYSQPQQSQSFWGNVKKSFSGLGSGYMTGFTPPVATYSYFDSPFKFYPPRPHANFNNTFSNFNNFHPNSNFLRPYMPSQNFGRRY